GGRLSREVAVTLSVAIAISLCFSLTTTPMMCARLLRARHAEQRGRLYRASERIFQWILGLYESTLAWVLNHPRLTIQITLGTIALTVYLYIVVPKGFFPQRSEER